MAFKLGSGRKSIYDNNKGFTLKRTELEGNVMGLATKNNVIHVNSKIVPGSKLYKETIAHEYDHMKRLNNGELSYGDDYIRHKNKTYHRKNGKVNYNGKWHKEGSKDLPWEKLAYNNEKKIT
jgi:hypothetical protein